MAKTQVILLIYTDDKEKRAEVEGDLALCGWGSPKVKWGQEDSILWLSYDLNLVGDKEDRV